MEENKSHGEILEEKLLYNIKNSWEHTNEEKCSKIFEFNEDYKNFLNIAKTEREFVSQTEALAIKKGFIPLSELMLSNKRIKPGTKIIHTNKNKYAILCVVGSNDLVDGVNIIGSHIDSPRIDLKQKPIYEDTGLVLLKTHYYGGIKKYQWVTIPLALHGVIVKNDGSIIEIKVGEDEGDPVFTITDLLPHLASKQMQKKMSEGITGEGLNILFGSIPYNDSKIKEKVKLNILKLLNDKYGLIEEDFVSAELEIVPAFKARDVGFDRGMIGGYGQDDRVCAYPSVRAILELKNIKKTAICVLTDKEEIGSVGNTGAKSNLLENFTAYLGSCVCETFTDIDMRKCLENSKMLSADVNPGVDPNYEGVQDKKNSSFINKGIIIQKYTGVKGKVGGSDANAEFVGALRNFFNENKINWQTGELGKVDEGGGGTIAQYASHLGIEVVDCGVPILSMHSPYEVVGKIDVYSAFDAYKLFFSSFL